METTKENVVNDGSQSQERLTVDIDEEYEIWMLLMQVRDGMIQARENEVKPFGLTATQVGVMWLIRKLDEPPTPSDLSRWLLRRPPTIYQLLDRMEKQGLVRCVADTKSKRKTRVILTEEGEAAYRQQRNERLVIPRILATLSQEERAQFKAMLQKIRTKTFEELAARPLFP